MSSSDIAVSVRGLSKAYQIAHDVQRHTTAAEALVHKIRNPFKRDTRETFWALRDVSFDIKKGDVVGIIGRNGAGKSTLLKVLSRITEPTKGEIILNGRVGSLLEVGTGFHPELTGRENIFLNGAILGMTRQEIKKHFDAIVDFAGVEKFLDTPVKRYSSGMYVRLAFAVAAYLNPEILIVDEVLAVGDAEFQKKCIGKMQDVAKSGRTVLFVTHNLTAAATLCNNGIVMQNGQVASMGTISDAIQIYTSKLRQANSSHKTQANKEFGFVETFLANLDEPDETDINALYNAGRYAINFDCVLPPSQGLNVGFTLVNSDEIAVVSCSALDSIEKLPVGLSRFQVELPVNALPSGNYRIEAAIWDSGKVYEQSDGLLFFTVISPNTLDMQGGKPRGAMLITAPWSVLTAQDHVNVSDLQSEAAVA